MTLATTARALTFSWMLCASSIALAGRRVVLKADGNASAAVKAKVEVQVLRLAKHVDASAEAGDVTFADAAAAVGCSGDELRCRDELVSTLAVDEFVSTTVTALPNGDVHVLVRRVPKAGPIRDTQTTILSGQSIESSLATSAGPVFGVKAKPLSSTTNGATPYVGSSPAEVNDASDAVGAPPRLSPSQSQQPATEPGGVATGPNEDPGRGRSAKPIVGLAVGGALVSLSVILWSQAAATQSDINAAPTGSISDFRYLRDLEAKGEAYANVGNVFFIAGAVVAGVSGYFLWRDRRAPSTQARIGPAVFNRGAGIALTIGGTP